MQNRGSPQEECFLQIDVLGFLEKGKHRRAELAKQRSPSGRALGRRDSTFAGLEAC